MSTFFAQYPASASGSNPSVGRDGQTAPLYATEIGGVDAAGDLIPVSVDSAGNINVHVVSAFVPTAYDEIDLTYVLSGNGAGQIQTVTYKLATVVVALLTMSYDSSNNLIQVLKT